MVAFRWTAAEAARLRREPLVRRPCDFWGLEHASCRFIVEGTGLKARYCNKGVEPGFSWCRQHLRRIFVRPPRPRL